VPPDAVAVLVRELGLLDRLVDDELLVVRRPGLRFLELREDVELHALSMPYPARFGSPMPYEHILYEVENGRARTTLTRPERGTALSPPLLDELERALWDADDDKRVHCVI